MFQTTKQFVIIFFCNDHLVREKLTPRHDDNPSPTPHGPNVQGGGPPSDVNVGEHRYYFTRVYGGYIYSYSDVNVGEHFIPISQTFDISPP